MYSKEFSQVWAGSSHFNFPFLSIKKHDRRSTTDTRQVFASHNFWHLAWVLDLSSSHSTVPKVPKPCWTDLRAGTVPSLLPILFPSHSELATWDTDIFGSCMNVRSIVPDTFPLSSQAGVEALTQDQREAWFIVWILNISLSFHAIVLFASPVCSISGKWGLLVF